MQRKALLFGLLVIAFIYSACESREQSLIREQGYLEANPPEEVANYEADVVYASPGGHELTMDISWPEGEGPFPCLVIIHGGGWELHTNRVMQGMARYITNRGYAVFNINYRTLPEGITMQEIVEDCLGAIIWVKEHAQEYNGDPERIAVTGDSAGGHLTAMVVTRGTDPEFNPTYTGSGRYHATVNCAIPTYGVYEFKSISKITAGMYTKRIFGSTYKADPELYERFSPKYFIRADLVPQLIIVGNLDPLYAANRAYQKALEDAGAPVKLHVVKGQSHAFLNYYWEDRGRDNYDVMIEFLDRHLK
jgi:acetyl esterase